jgi:dihydrofolate reductase
MTSQQVGRRVVGNITLSLDGRVSGRGGEYDMGWIVPHAVTDGARDHMTRLFQPATTALLGRKNYQGFGGYWPAVAKDETAEPRDRAFAQWLDAVEKVVVSTTVKEAEWNNARIVNADPADVVKELRRAEGGDILVLNSVSVIRSLLAADELDRLSVLLCPEIVGAGARLWEDGLPATGWRPDGNVLTTESGAHVLYYDRVRDTAA